MKPRACVLLIAMALGGCATTTSNSLPVCDGKHRRPANPHGSVLNAPPPAAGPLAPTGAAAPVAPAVAQPSCGA
jgi:hypothetical protein